MTIRPPVTTATIGLGLLALLACDRSEDQPRGANHRKSTETLASTSSATSDETFLKTAALSNLTEVEAGRLAQAKSADSEIKKFGQRMVDDHSKANRELTDLATKKGIRLPDRLDPDHQKEIDRLSGKSGRAFDLDFIGMMVTDHVNAVSLFEENAQRTTDPEVRSFAEKTLPVLHDHLKMARDVKGKLSAPGYGD